MADPFPAGPLVIPAHIWTQMLDHVLRARPEEACGVLGGRDGRAVRWYPCANVHPQKETRYTADPRDLLRAIRDMDDHGLEQVAIFHSHPATRAYPSETDVAQAHYPECLYLIVSLADPARPDLHGFWIRDGRITEHPVVVEPAGADPESAED